MTRYPGDVVHDHLWSVAARHLQPRGKGRNRYDSLSPPLIMENQMEKKMENEMETAIYRVM